MNISVLVIEDDSDDTILLLELLKKVPFVVQVKAVPTIEEVLEGILQDNYDLVFLDLQLANANGLDILRSITLPATIVVSAHPSYAISTYDIDSVVDFIEKPVSYNRLIRALKRANVGNNTVKHLYLKAGRQMLHFDVDNIKYIEADGIYSKICLKDNSYVLVNDNISEIEKKLRRTRLMRLHKSYIYNLDFMTAFDSRNIFMGTQMFQLGVHYRSKLGQFLDIGNNNLE